MATAEDPSTAPQPPSRSQSPLPPAPTETLPGTRATMLSTVFSKALTATLERVTPDNFAACFPTTAQQAPETLDAFRRDFTSKLDKACRGEFDNILRDRDVVKGLNELDGMVEAARRRKAEEEVRVEREGGEVQLPVVPHTLPASTLINAHLAPFLAAQQATLTKQLTTLQTQNTQLFAQVQQQEAEMETQVQALELLVRDLERSADLLQGEEVAGLGLVVREVEMELAG